MDMREELLTLLTLKDIPRTGWVRAGVSGPESVAAHSWGMAILALRLCPDHLDLSKVLQLCLVHDVAEIVVGDLTPHDAIKGQEKHELEREGMRSIAPQWIELFDEYEQGSTEEAQFVKTMDKLDMGLQAINYQQQGLNLSEFIKSARSKTDGTEFASLLE
ncbi:MAG: HD domain-containing protein [Candidatus Poseidoniaceae archaeon]